MKKALKILLYIFIIIAIIWSLFMLWFSGFFGIFSSLGDRSNPLRRSNEEIRESILELTPIGTSMDEVLNTIETNTEWEREYMNENTGYSMNFGRPSFPSSFDISENREIIGVKSIRVTIGTYSGSFKTYVIVYWGFDENSTLIDLAVRKDIDGL